MLPSAALSSNGVAISRPLPLIELPVIESGVGAWVRGLVHVLPLALEVVYIWLVITGGTSAGCGLSMLCTLPWD